MICAFLRLLWERIVEAWESFPCGSMYLLKVPAGVSAGRIRFARGSSYRSFFRGVCFVARTGVTSL